MPEEQGEILITLDKKRIIALSLSTLIFHFSWFTHNRSLNFDSNWQEFSIARAVDYYSHPPWPPPPNWVPVADEMPYGLDSI
jgi:hypothetical protein